MTTPTTTPVTYVLVPGAWLGGWVWHPVAQRLRAAGQRALALTMPGLGDGDDPTGTTLDDAVAHVVDQVERRVTGEVVLVGHSWGGVPVTGAAHPLRERVRRVVYCDAFVPTRGVALNDESPPEWGDQVRAEVAASPQGAVSVPFEVFAAVLMPDQPEPAQRLVHNLLVPTPGRYLTDALDAAPVADLGIPTAYVLAEEDHALAVPGDQLAARLGVEPVAVPGGHLALFTHPDEVARALLAA